MSTPTVPAPPLDGPGVRASDADRHRVERILQGALGAGMLSLAETEERLGAVHAARFRHELPPLTADLPVDELVPAVAGPSTGWLARLLVQLLHVITSIRATVAAATVRQRVVFALTILAGVVLALHALTSGLEGAFSPEDHQRVMGR